MENETHTCGLCQLHPTEWSFYAFFICAVAATWRLENPKPRVIRQVPTLAGIAGTVMQRECK